MESIKASDLRLTDAQLQVIDAFEKNKLFHCTIYKRWHCKPWFQVNYRSSFEISDQTVSALVRKGLIYKKDDNNWIRTELTIKL